MLETMRIATWNVNSIKARSERLLRWLDTHKPDVLCLQELKAEDSGFPLAEVQAAGYSAVLYGQKTYNGVAILSREPARNVRAGLDDDVDDPQARLLSAELHGLTFLSCYVPNGSEPSSDKFAYKLKWLERLLAYLEKHHDAREQLVLCGDLNIAPADIDVARPEEWKDTVLCHPLVREAFQQLLAFGLVDSFRALRSDAAYSWWDYRMLGFPKGNGLRIDHVLVTKDVLARCKQAQIDREERKGKLPSDHAPVFIDLD
jgi:exodeoxyribonuclease-3